MTHPDPARSWPAPTGWPGAMGPPPSRPDPRRPGIATAAAVLGFVEAGLALLWLLPSLVAGLALGASSSPGWFFTLVAVLVGCGGLLLGGVRLLRGAGWRLLVGTTAVEIAALVTPVLIGSVVGAAPGAVVVVVLVVLLALPATRLGLLLPRRVSAWVDRQTPVPNRWLGPLVLSPVAVALLLTLLTV